MRRFALFAAGIVAAFLVAGCAASASAPKSGTVPACTAYAYHAIQVHQVVTAVPAACGGLTRAQVNQAASTAIRLASGSGPKSAWRAQAGVAAPWVKALLTGPVQASGGASASEPSGGGTPGSLLGGGSEFAVQIAALVAWLITAASGGYVLGRWWRAGGRLRRQTDTAVPPVVTLGHPGLGLLGLVIWAVFVATGWVPLAWVAVGLLAALAGLGMAILVIGLPSPRSPASPAMPGNGALAQAGATAVLVAPPAPARQGPRQPVLVIALHGLFAVAVLALALTAAVGAG